MTPTQFRAALDRLSLSQGQAAKLLNADPRTTRRWALGERSIPPTVAILLRLMIAGKVNEKDIEKASK